LDASTFGGIHARKFLILKLLGRSIFTVRPLGLIAAFLAACGGGSARTPHGTDPGAPATGDFAEEDRYVPSYSKSDLQRALEKERGAEASAERLVADLEATDATDDRRRVAAADLAVRRNFIASLEACESSGRQCPPRLDDPPWAFDPDPGGELAPPITATLRFDLGSWRTLTAELHGRACACRTISCVDSVGVAIDQLEPRPMPDVQGDEEASRSLTRARECLFRLRGRHASFRAVRNEEQ
jgi:hypothetical protein